VQTVVQEQMVVRATLVFLANLFLETKVIQVNPEKPDLKVQQVIQDLLENPSREKKDSQDCPVLMDKRVTQEDKERLVNQDPQARLVKPESLAMPEILEPMAKTEKTETPDPLVTKVTVAPLVCLATTELQGLMVRMESQDFLDPRDLKEMKVAKEKMDLKVYLEYLAVKEVLVPPEMLAQPVSQDSPD